MVRCFPALLLCLTLLAPTAVAGQTDDDRDAIGSVLDELVTSWNARDAEGWVARFTEDSGFTNILGTHFRDRDANRARHALLFESVFAESTLAGEVAELRPLGDDAAVATVLFTLTGYTSLPPGVMETEPGVLRTRLLTVLQRREGGWWIVEAQNTAVMP